MTKAATLTYHHDLGSTKLHSSIYVWEQIETIPFDELIVSWNALRPQVGEFVVFISIKTNVWSSWQAYAVWSGIGQGGVDLESTDAQLRINQDIVEILGGQLACGFRICVEARNGAALQHFFALHACASRIKEMKVIPFDINRTFIDLDVPKISQMQLNHPRNKDMCSPTSTSSAIAYLLNLPPPDPVTFALNVQDQTFDIFGNWVLNTAQAFAVLGNSWSCSVQRLNGFNDIYEKLSKKMPVVVSVRGLLKNSAMLYSQGHLIVVKGYDPKNRHVLCMDPAFPTNEATFVSYSLDDFLEAWGRRRYVCYLFERREDRRHHSDHV